MGQRAHYWSCTKFADWVRGTPKLSAGTSKEWNNWRKEAAVAHSVRNWIAEEALDAVQNFIWWPADQLYSVKYYINNRWVTKTHQLTANPSGWPSGIKPGDWRDVGNRFLPCLFNELVDFVEVELAWWHIAWDKDARKKFKSPFYATGWFRWRTWRSAECGLDNLEWQRNLRWKENEVGEGSENIGKPTPQAINAQEILDLYNWWITERPKRKDPHDESGWSAHCNKKREGNDDILSFLDHEDETEEQRAEVSRILELSSTLEAAHEKEDEDMMIRLIKVRNSLWT